MKVLIIGLGSMGKRRLRLIRDIDSSINIIGLDSNEERSEEVSKEYGIAVYKDLSSVMSEGDMDAVFVCTSPLSHHNIIDKLLEYDIPIFTELNLVSDGYEKFINEEKLFLSSTFLYREDIKWIINKVNGMRVNYVYHTGQYLPDWHPWEDYRKYFVGEKKSNGCREIMAIELPWITEAFGDIVDFNVIRDKMSDLEVDYPDNYMMSFVHKSGIVGLVAVDVVSRNASRRLEVFGENNHILWDGKPDSLKDYNLESGQFETIRVYDDVVHREGYSSNIIENAYRAEIEAFFSLVAGKKDSVRYSFKKDYKILQLIDSIESEG